MKEKEIEELEAIIFGKRLGGGIHRDVYVFKPDQTKVIKVANCQEGRGMNLIAEKIFDNIRYTPTEKWFAEIFSVSQFGKYLIQERIEQLPKEQYPDKIPHFFTDTKYENFGHIKGKGLVCVDYGAFNMFRGITSRMKRAEWFG